MGDQLPQDDALLPPLDFAALGLEQQERIARQQLRENLLKSFDDLSVAELAEPKSHVRLFPAFREYAKQLLEAYAAGTASKVSSSEEFGDGLRQFLRSVICHMAPPPWTKIPEDQELPFDADDFLGNYPKPGTRAWLYKCLQASAQTPRYRQVTVRVGPEADDLETEQEEYRLNPLDHIEPDCLWEQAIWDVIDDPEVSSKLPRGAVGRFVFAFRKNRQDLVRSVKDRLRPLVTKIEGNFVTRTVSSRQTKPGSERDHHAYKTALEITDRVSGDWKSGEDLDEVCRLLDEKGVTPTRSLKSKSLTWTQAAAGEGGMKVGNLVKTIEHLRKRAHELG